MSQMWSIYVPTGTHFEKMDQSVCVRELEAEGLGALFVHLSQRVWVLESYSMRKHLREPQDSN